MYVTDLDYAIVSGEKEDIDRAFLSIHREIRFFYSYIASVQTSLFHCHPGDLFAVFVST